jgi:hypothetical protein
MREELDSNKAKIILQRIMATLKINNLAADDRIYSHFEGQNLIKNQSIFYEHIKN